MPRVPLQLQNGGDVMIPEGMTVEQEMEYWRTWTPEAHAVTADDVQDQPGQAAPEAAESPEYARLRAAGFLVTQDGEAEYRIGALSSVIIERDGHQWHAYRIRWYADGRMQTYKTLYKGAYSVAVRKACEMADWVARKRKDDGK